MSIICCRMPGHRKGWLTHKPLAESASSFAAEWHFLVTLCLNEARQVRPHASVSDRRSGTEGVETPHRRPPTNPRIGPPPCSELNRARVRSLRTVGIWNISWTFLSMVLDDRNRYPSAEQVILGAEAVHDRFNKHMTLPTGKVSAV